MKAQISLDVMTNNGRNYYGTVKGELPLQYATEGGERVSYIRDKDVQSLVLERFPTLKRRKFTLRVNYANLV